MACTTTLARLARHADKVSSLQRYTCGLDSKMCKYGVETAALDHHIVRLNDVWQVLMK